ncbi:MAG: hypothetical protein EA402_10235 [Planctomycetota bacterium]|nr:MAG: hypothetical protein EA402_10235 [Planctomycetota bacterium]
MALKFLSLIFVGLLAGFVSLAVESAEGPQAALDSVLPADQPDLTWTYVPPAVFLNDIVTLSFRSSETPSLVHYPRGSRLQSGDDRGAWNLVLPAAWTQGAQSIAVRVGNRDYWLHAQLPGSQDGDFAYDAASHRLHRNGDPVLLVAQRRDLRADRRYRMLRQWRPASPQQIPRLHWPAAAAWGTSPLLQALPRWREAMREDSAADRLFIIDYREWLVGWDPAALAATLTWLVAEARSRDHRPWLLSPLADQQRADEMAMLQEVMSAVAQDLGVRVYTPKGFDRPAFWEVSAGVIGPWLNADGRQDFARWLSHTFNLEVAPPDAGWLP